MGGIGVRISQKVCQRDNRPGIAAGCQRGSCITKKFDLLVQEGLGEEPHCQRSRYLSCPVTILSAASSLGAIWMVNCAVGRRGEVGKHPAELANYV